MSRTRSCSGMTDRLFDPVFGSRLVDRMVSLTASSSMVLSDGIRRHDDSSQKTASGRHLLYAITGIEGLLKTRKLP